MKIKIEDIREELKKDGWILISDKYENLDSELVFECNEGHRVFSSWKKLRHKRECPICKNNKYKEQDTSVVPKKPKIKRVLGLDQATYINGWSIFDGKELVKYGLFETNANEAIERAEDVKNWLINMINNWRPDLVALEGIQFQNNLGSHSIGVTTFEALARFQGILMMACRELKIPFEICHTQTWRSYCGVKGKTRADKKKSAQLIVKSLYDISVTNDAADAILIGKYASDTFFNKTEVVDWE